MQHWVRIDSYQKAKTYISYWDVYQANQLHLSYLIYLPCQWPAVLLWCVNLVRDKCRQLPYLNQQDVSQNCNPDKTQAPIQDGLYRSLIIGIVQWLVLF